jgi:uncharacterized protein YdbL (DUF1318 family)
MSRKFIIITVLIVFGMATYAGAAWGQDIKARMRARLPVIVKLKDTGVVGENNKGYLVILKKSTHKKSVIEAENKDRRTIYAAIAKRQGTTPDLVGKRRALQIAEKADSGTMIQGKDGKWRKK